MQLDLQQVQDADLQKKPLLFLQYCRTIIKATDRGELSIEDAAYNIAGAMVIQELKSPLFDQITNLAGSLELPYYISGVQINEGWSRLTKLVDEYAQSLHEDK